MSNVIINEQYLNDIADAIRNKNGKTKTYKPREMADEIRSFNQSECEAIIQRTITQYSNSTIEYMKQSSFAYCSSLTSINLPALKAVEMHHFVNCSALIDVNIPSAEIIMPEAFRDCKSLQSIVLPNVQIIHSDAFAKCSSLTRVDTYNLIDLKGYVYTTYGQREMTIFSDTALDTLILRANAVCDNSRQNIIEGLFRNTPIENGTGYIYVPSALVEQYKSSIWSCYANQIRAIEDYPDICGEALL